MILDVTCGARLMWQKYGVLMTTWRKPPILLVQALFWGPWQAYQGIFELNPSEHRSGNDTLDNYPLYADQEK